MMTKKLFIACAVAMIALISCGNEDEPSYPKIFSTELVGNGVILLGDTAITAFTDFTDEDILGVLKTQKWSSDGRFLTPFIYHNGKIQQFYYEKNVYFANLPQCIVFETDSTGVVDNNGAVFTYTLTNKTLIVNIHDIHTNRADSESYKILGYNKSTVIVSQSYSEYDSLVFPKGFMDINPETAEVITVYKPCTLY